MPDTLNKLVSETNGKPLVSIIIPCRNEEKYIGKSLDSVIANTYPKEKIEIFIIDGSSEDRTRDIIRDYAEKYPFISLLDNEEKIVPTALNKAIEKVKGEIVIRLDAHNIYDKNYISKCVECLDKYNADNVGGIWVTRPGSTTTVAKTIAIALSHPFGVGNSTYRLDTKKPRLVDTVPFGCYRKDVFDRIGGFNKFLERNQDIEFNLRLKKAGGKILLVPEIVSYYHARSNLQDLAKQNFWNGYWVVYSTKFAKLPFSFRHFIPFVFVVSALGSLALSTWISTFIIIFGIVLGSYLIANIYITIRLSLKKGMKYFLFLPLTFLTLHFSYGLGSLWGLRKIALSKFNFKF